MTNLLDHDLASMQAFFTEIGEKPFRATQLIKWIYQQGIVEFEDMTNLSKALRERLAAETHITLPEIVTRQDSADGTVKWMMRVDEKNSVETVFIPEKDRGTLCISSQVGCALDCSFCSTAQQGFSRNLTAGEIIGQVWLANKELGYFDHGNRVISNIVFMGMGEPLMNYNNVLKTVRLLTDDNAFGLARKRVTLSTSGLVPKIDQLREDSNISLAISLHAPEDNLRNELVPLNKKYQIKQLLDACERYAKANANAPITIEYVMLAGVNDQPEHARRLIKVLGNLPVKINLIPFNDFPGTRYDCSSKGAIERFQSILMKANMFTITRKTRGDDIDAACGQLVGKVMTRAKRQRKTHKQVIHDKR